MSNVIILSLIKEFYIILTEQRPTYLKTPKPINNFTNSSLGHLGTPRDVLMTGETNVLRSSYKRPNMVLNDMVLNDLHKGPPKFHWDHHATS